MRRRGMLRTRKPNRAGKTSMTSPRNIQLAIEASKEFAATICDGDMPPLLIPDPERVRQPFMPRRAELIEVVSATYGHSEDGPDITLHETVSDGADVKLVQAFTGCLNCFPYAPDTARGTLGPELNATEDLKWPNFAAGVDFYSTFALQCGILSRARHPIPADYNPSPKSIKVQVRLTLSGPVVRQGASTHE